MESFVNIFVDEQLRLEEKKFKVHYCVTCRVENICSDPPPTATISWQHSPDHAGHSKGSIREVMIVSVQGLTGNRILGENVRCTSHLKTFLGLVAPPGTESAL